MTPAETACKVTALLAAVSVLRREGRRAEAITLLDQGVTALSETIGETEWLCENEVYARIMGYENPELSD